MTECLSRRKTLYDLRIRLETTLRDGGMELARRQDQQSHIFNTIFQADV